MSNQGNDNSVYINDSFHNSNPEANDSFQGSTPGAFEHIFKTLIDKSIGAAGAIIGTAAICYGADAAATSVFPPAAALAPFCAAPAALGASVGGAGTVARVVVQH